MDPYKKQSIKDRVKRNAKKDYDTIPVKNSQIDSISKRMKKNFQKEPDPKSPKRQIGKPGAAGTTFKTKKPVTKA